MSQPICEVCGKNASTATLTIPTFPTTVDYCQECIDAGAHPLWALVSKTASLYSGNGYVLANTTDEWFEMVNATLAYLNIPFEDFTSAVKDVKRGMDEAMEPTVEDMLLHLAWGVISDAMDFIKPESGDKEREWSIVAGLWRDRYHELLANTPGLTIGEPPHETNE